jgi:hypothetical protein
MIFEGNNYIVYHRLRTIHHGLLCDDTSDREFKQVNLIQAQHVDENLRVLPHASEGAEELTPGTSGFQLHLEGRTLQRS